ncbi:MAG: alpha-L-fucosidase, partial [Bacteroidetes Order II. Incertae sedis bacterium]|nr:alpha-L-fucosidase [Bacteroidetes Order II. bacterium]
MNKRTSGLLVALFLLVIPFKATAQTSDDIVVKSEQPDPKMDWFKDARLGIFIHWGIYAVDGIDESWSFFNKYVSYDDYMKQLDGFTAAKYDPAAWADLIQESGAQYAVLTSKHHDGVALWDTDLSELNVVDATPAGKDLIEPWVHALRQRGLKAGIYFSHLDWSHPDYDVHIKDVFRYKNDPVRWARFKTFHLGQLRELSDRFQPDLWWFDGDWEHSAEEWGSAAIRDSLLAWNPETILNSRLNGFGDYATPEQGLPTIGPDGPWELCMTMNDSWGYQENDLNYKTPYQIIRTFADVLDGGGNLLLDIGPKADGSIPDEQVDILKEMGRWTTKHAEAIYGTNRGIEPGHFYGPTTVSADGSTLYLFLPHKPSGPVVVKGLKNKVDR